MIKRAEGDGGAENIVLLGWLLVALKWTRSEGAGLGSRATAYRTTDCREIAPESWLDHPRYPLPPHLAVSQPGGWQGVTRETRKGLNVPCWKLVSEQPQGSISRHVSGQRAKAKEMVRQMNWADMWDQPGHFYHTHEPAACFSKPKVRPKISDDQALPKDESPSS